MAVGVGFDYFSSRNRRLVVGAAVGSSNIAARVAYVKDGREAAYSRRTPERTCSRARGQPKRKV